ncbi:hypothetical protein D7X55_25565 [Corallococcus sp. AB049A]|uniref:DUF155 domain-containing protein n=1 Tax=Corallococcus interemptor TaxID=2316720 RepID=A0A3A8QDH0_9BACT|nr:MULTISPECIES: hypothetical protein [Corallococcus]RKH40823.1 hypothetical protein D7Y23_34075 [Corallococcus sp. AB050B]RKH64335.1 hypothetical protein D7X96_25865 [Corallococcus interemptor]RKI59563.1 hypothetical protein D7X55_25565 [Corallococcus sp. AB049A]
MSAPAGMTLLFEQAHILCYRTFDIAEEIDLERARKALTEDSRRLKLSRENSQYIQLPNPPVAYELGRRPLALRGGPVTVDATARLFDHGAASIILRVPVAPGTTWETLTHVADELYDSQALEDLALELVEGVRRTISAAVQGPHLWDQSESYTVIFAERIQGNPSAEELFQSADIARLLLGESTTAPLAPREREAVTQVRFSYTAHDLVVVDWNSAFVYEPSGSRDIPDLLEIANAQLLEFRYYDERLDKHIARIHDEVQKRKPGWLTLFRSPYRTLARETLGTLVDLNEFVERVENSLKIIGDFYLAKVYEGAVRRLRIPAWQASVTRKQQLLAQTYGLLKGEVDIDRSHVLEVMIVALIVLEILLAFGRVVMP